MDTRKAVSNRLLELCAQKNLAVHALARISAIPPSTLKNVINGGSLNPGIVTLKKLCDGFGITLGEFLVPKNLMNWNRKLNKKMFSNPPPPQGTRPLT